jgi:hypothetical protein
MRMLQPAEGELREAAGKLGAELAKLRGHIEARIHELT